MKQRQPRTKPLPLTPDRVREIVRKGGPTFRCVTGRKFVCNQDKALGRLSRRQVETLKVACARRGTKWWKPVHQQPAKLKSALIDGQNDVQCPHCQAYNYDVHPGPIACRSCNAQFRVSGERRARLSSPSSGSSSLYGDPYHRPSYGNVW